jgi:tetratricopeptide (TPR) repeat protein
MNLRFPLDLSGGVPSFRHRRGTLERVVIYTDLERLRKWAEPRVRSLGGPLARPLDVYWTECGLGIGIVRETSVVAWELVWAPVMGHARLVVANARGWGLNGPALGEVLRIMDVLGGKTFERRGRVFLLKDAGRFIARALLPSMGARVPAATGVAFGPFKVEEQSCRLELDSKHTQAELSGEAMRALELSRLTQAGDEALLRGELDVARNELLLALDSAPRQKELVLLIAEIDALFGRVEAAIGLISESMPLLASGAVGAHALMHRGERAAAADLLALSAREERYSPLAAFLQFARSECESSAAERRLTLDAAVAAAPSLSHIRWARLAIRAELGDASGALSDAQHLEARAIGRQARYAVCQRAAELMRNAGMTQQACSLFQRALRYAPDDVGPMVGLARALAELGEGLRAIPLLQRAVQVAEGSGQLKGAALIELARLLATKLNDLPNAVAELRRVPVDEPSVVQARGLEARYRLMLGDVIGASVAFSKMRDLIEAVPADPEFAPWLIEAGRFERDVQHDHTSAERHLALALRLSPQDVGARELYREISAVLAAKRQRRLEST